MPSAVKNILCLCLWLATTFSAAAEKTTPMDDSIRHHLIIAVDWSPTPGANDWRYSWETREAIVELAKHKIADGTGKPRKVIKKGDLFSCLTFRTDVNQASLDQYVACIKPEKVPLTFVESKSDAQFQRTLKWQWDKWLDCVHMDGSSTFSLLTVAKPYCLGFFADMQPNKAVNRTFIIVVSDHVYNGDFYGEVTNWKQMHAGRAGENVDDKKVYQLCYSVNQAYYIRFLRSIQIMQDNHYAPKGYADLYEFVPLQENFFLASTVNYPPVVKAKRVRNGQYQCDFAMIPNGNPSYEVLQIDASLGDSANTTKRWVGSDFTAGNELRYAFRLGNPNRPDSLKLKAWVRLTDGVYNATVLSPSPQSTLEAGRRGLNVALPIEYENKANFFFGTFPDFLWWECFPDDQHAAARLWEFIFIAVGIVALAYVIIRLYKSKQYYKPQKGDLEIIIDRKIKNTRNTQQQ